MARRPPPHLRRTPDLGTLLRERRIELQLSLREVSDLTGGGISASALSRLEASHRYPSLYTLEYLAEALTITITVDRTGTTIDWKGKK